MEAGFASRAILHGCLQVVEDDAARTATEEFKGMDDSAVELLFALQERELDIDQPAIAEHGDKHRDLARCVTDSYAAALAPIDLHRLARLVVDFLIDATARRAYSSQVAANDTDAAFIAVGTASDLLADAYRREVGILGEQGVDLGRVRVQVAGVTRDLAPGGLFQRKRRGHGMPRAVESS